MGKEKATINKKIQIGSQKHFLMQIITEILSVLNTITVILYGPNEIPVWHHLYGKKLQRHGTYTRSLYLSSGLKIIIVVFRFRELLPPGSNHKSITYSLLPFYITPNERHINTTIDNAIESYFFQRRSLLSISKELNISPATIKRWVSRFHEKANGFCEKLEKILTDAKPGFRPASTPIENIFDTVKSIFRKVFIVVLNKNILIDYGITSWLNFTFQI
jgi:ribosome-binding ATPase YchF (GTP1/OBG family)